MPTEEELKQMWEPAPLHPDLVPYLVPASGKLGWPMLKHPLVFSVPYFEAMNGTLNAQYTFKKQKVNEARKARDWGQFIFFWERPYRIEALQSIAKEMSDTDYWQFLGAVWSDSENLWEYGPLLGAMLGADRPGREQMMDERDREVYDRLPPLVTVYRGHQQINRNGYSWSLSHRTAEWFSRRFSAKRSGVVQGKVRKEDVIAVLVGRNEMEVITEPDSVVEKKAFTVRLAKKDESTLNQALLVHKLGRKGYHGPEHWLKVHHNATYLARRTPGADLDVCRAFALLHDCMRETEGDDPEHGRRAAQLARDLHRRGLLDLDAQQMTLLEAACHDHERGITSDDPTIGVCFDADRLELTRVSIVPDPNLLSTEAGKASIFQI